MCAAATSRSTAIEPTERETDLWDLTVYLHQCVVDTTSHVGFARWIPTYRRSYVTRATTAVPLPDCAPRNRHERMGIQAARTLMSAPFTRRRVLWAFGVYIVLLWISLVVRTSHAEWPDRRPGDRIAETQQVDGTHLTAGKTQLAYRDLKSSAGSSTETVVLLHGSPGHKEDFDRLAPLLAQRVRVLVPDLPGFGASDHHVPDYSFRAHAVYVRQLLDQLGIRSAHVVGFSMGGGVALSLVDLAPERVASLTLLSAIGVQEMELTGDYYVNHVVHGAQLAALWTLVEATPHMGLLDGGMMGLPYARNFFDSDQRPLRDALRETSMPTLIVHGVTDHLVPFEAAVEHHRLVAQSALATFEGDHFLVFQRAPEIGAAIGTFIESVLDGRARTRSNADPERVRDAIPTYSKDSLPQVRGIAAAVFSGVLAAGAAVSAVIAPAAAGMLVARGRVSPTAAVAGCLLGIWLGHVARTIWRRAVGRQGSVSTTHRRLQRARRSGQSVLIRIAASAIASRLLFQVTALASPTSSLSVAATIALVTALVEVGSASATERGRRLMVSRWRRATKWEFWPPWIFYPPVVVYVAYLMVKHRSATLFTAANPAILSGGFIGESKYEILRGLASANEFVARASLIDGRLNTVEKTRAVSRFMSDHGLTLPIVLKPDHGQRGSGVVVVRSAEDVSACLRQSSVDTIVQEYVGGAEFGVFYYRRPAEPRGHIFSVTEKTLPTVVGDGRRTLEQLILHDERAVCAARLYLDRHRGALSSVPLEGDVCSLAELGTHCRGAMFLDGAWVVTPALETRFDAIARSFDGFYFGRFDVRVEGTIEEFQAGEGFKVIELNGVTSEATHIYQPGTPLIAAYRVLREQWRIAFEIGKENRSRGVPPTSLRQLMQLMREYRHTARGHLQERPPQTARAELT